MPDDSPDDDDESSFVMPIPSLPSSSSAKRNELMFKGTSSNQRLIP